MIPDIAIMLVDRFFWLYQILIVIRVILSWVQVRPRGFFKVLVDFVYDVTEPLLKLFRRFLPIVDFGGMGIDLSPIIAIFVIELLHTAIMNILVSL